MSEVKVPTNTEGVGCAPLMNAVPDGWTYKAITEITSLKHGFQFRTPDFADSGIKVVKIGQVVGAGKIALESCDFVRTEVYEERRDFELKTGDILMSLTGNIGRVGIVPHISAPLLQNYRVGLFEPIDDRCHKQFLFQLLGSELVTQQLLDKSNSTAQANFGKSDLDQVTVRLPPLPEQQKIAQILTSVDEVIEKTQAQIDKLKDLKTGMMQELLTKGIGHIEFKDSPLGSTPVGWDVKTLRDIAVTKGLQTGPFGAQLHAHEYVEQGIPVIMPKDMKNNRVVTGTIAKITSEKADGLERHKVEAGDILFSRRGDIGRFVLVEKKNEGWICGTGCLKARLNDLIEPAFFASYLTLVTVVEWLNNNAVGQTMLNLNTSILSDLPVMLPPKAEQKIIAKTVESLDQRTISLSLKYEKLQSIKKALMQDLLTGKVRVSTEQSNSSVAVD